MSTTAKLLLEIRERRSPLPLTDCCQALGGNRSTVNEAMFELKAAGYLVAIVPFVVLNKDEKRQA